MDYLLSLDMQFVKGMLFQLVNTAIIIFILWKVLYNPVKDFMKKRKDRIENQLNDANVSQNKASELKKEYEDKMSNITVEKTAILDEARKRGKDIEKTIIDEAKEEAKTIKERAKKDIEREQDKVKDEMRKQIIELSTELSRKYISQNISNDTQNKLLEEVISDLGGAKW